METDDWKIEDSPAIPGKIALVTGANTGLGFQTARALAQKDAHVVMACRNMEKAANAKNKILKAKPGAKLTTMEIDLANLESVREFASKFNLEFDKLDILVNNAGVMMPPYTLTDDGFELQYQANYLGHFLLTGLLLRKLESAEAARVISLGSLAHKWGDIYFHDMQFKDEYNKRKSYGQSKLACIMFAYELERRLRHTGSSIQSLAAHPGVANTQLIRFLPKLLKFFAPLFVPFIAQKAKKGALPQIRAALDTSLGGGTYLGPSGPDQYKGKPVVVDSNKKSKDEEVAESLWTISQRDAGIEYLDFNNRKGQSPEYNQ